MGVFVENRLGAATVNPNSRHAGRCWGASDHGGGRASEPRRRTGEHLLPVHELRIFCTGHEIQCANTREQLQFEERQGSAGAVLECAPILVCYRRGGCLAGRRNDGRLRRTDLWASRFY